MEIFLSAHMHRLINLVKGALNYNYHCIHRRIYQSQSFEIDSKGRRYESFEAYCLWALLNVQIITLLFPFTVQKLHLSSCQQSVAGSFPVQTPTWITGSLLN